MTRFYPFPFSEPQRLVEDRRIFSFPKAIAAECGDNAAAFLAYANGRMATTKVTLPDDRPAFFNTLDELTARLTYLKEGRIRSAIKNLQDTGRLVVEAANRYAYDRTQWFHVPEAARTEAGGELLYFDPEVARAHSLVTAVLLENIWHRWKELRDEEDQNPGVLVSPTATARAQECYSVSTVKRQLDQLRELGYIRRVEGKRGHFCLTQAAFNRAINPE